ncbi:neprosin family prolyl endopeptidase [Streptomyces sp. DSM 41987]|uniref:neprosin family prolyl endopeptidase n=1 Tax=Streptomyces TaxID=1883 RepID=UPI0018DF85B9|nr:neprosin family prolyl endopeptidase [Streptomyces fildesensis]
MSRRKILTALGVALVLAMALLLPAQSANASTCWYGSCFSYVSGQQEVSATGASVTMTQATPQVTAGHSLQELALRTDDRSAVVEIGWMVDPVTNGDYQPHLFVYHWVNNQTSCYNGCGFVPTSSSIRAGMTVRSGTSANFSIINYSGNWYVYYDNQPFGYFPGSLWGGRFTAAQNVSAFGEVADSGQTSCDDMANGQYGSGSGASSIAGYQLYGANSAPHFSVSATDPSYYNSGHATATSFTLGGPGAC